MASIMNYYPDDILAPHNRYRHIELIVKNQESLSGSVDELKKQIEKTAVDIKDSFSKMGSRPTEADEQKQMKHRTSLLTNAKTIYGVALPLPNELTETQTHSWESSEGIVASNVSKLADKELFGIASINKAVGEMASVGGFRKPMIDPGYFQDYKGTAPREFSFSWDLVPNNATEAEHILNLLYNLKKYTLPKTTINGISMLSPYLFEIKIGNARIDNLINMNNVVCTNMTINYSADNSLQFFADGIPKYMTLSMSFAERATVTSDLY